MFQAISREATVAVKRNVSCLTGKTIKVKDSLTKLVGSFYIESDKHGWENGKHLVIMLLNCIGVV